MNYCVIILTVQCNLQGQSILNTIFKEVKALNSSFLTEQIKGRCLHEYICHPCIRRRVLKSKRNILEYKLGVKSMHEAFDPKLSSVLTGVQPNVTEAVENSRICVEP